MKILSIDVGMKNLAVCLFNIKDNLEYEIELWDVLNLCNDKDFLCIGEKKDERDGGRTQEILTKQLSILSEFGLLARL